MLGTTLETWRKGLDTNETQQAQVLNPQVLEGLYDFFFCLSLDSSSSSQRPDVKFTDICDFQKKFTDICNLCNFLFKELSRRFKQLFADLGIDPTNVALEQKGDSLHSDTWGSPQDLILLLRCCMVMLQFLEFDLTLLLEKCQILFAILGKLCSLELASHISCHVRGNGRSAISFKRSVSREWTYVGDGGIAASVVEESEVLMSFAQQSASTFLCSIVEVFIYELLMHRKLRQYFMMVDSISCTNEKLFMCHLSHGDSDAVLELISAHFLLSVSDEQSFSKSMDALILWHAEEPPFLKQSLTAAMQLLGTPVMVSAPQILQAYMISFVAKFIGINMAPENQSVDWTLINCYVSSFEKSFILYCGHISSLFGDHPEQPESGPACSDNPYISGRGLRPLFESYIRPVTYNQINVQATKFVGSCHHLSSKKKSDLMSACIAYMKQNQNILDKSYRDEILFILSRIISRILSGEIGATLMLKKGDINQQEMYLLASIIKLMSCSLLQTTWYMQNGSSSRVKTLKDYSQCGEYDFIIGVIGCFRQYSVNQPIQNLIHDVMANEPAMHKESKQMFMHFAGLLLFSFESGLEFLCKGCVFMMMSLMNLFIFEEGNLDAFKPLPVFEKECLSSRSSSSISSEVAVGRSHSLIVASNFQKFQMLNLRMNTPIQTENSGGVLLIKDVEECALSIAEEKKTNNGKRFMKCVKGTESLADFDDMTDFIECKQGKDYSKWLKDREEYRMWKSTKTAVVRKESRGRLKAMLN